MDRLHAALHRGVRVVTLVPSASSAVARDHREAPESHAILHHTEINASIYDPKVVQALRCELFDEHIGVDTRRLEDVTALCLYAEAARLNAAYREDDWQGNVFALS
jgi:hypothetical protein